jgi:hypothetical protein
MINRDMKLKVIDLVIEDFSTRTIYNNGNARIIACYIKVLKTLKLLVEHHGDSETILYLDCARDSRGDMISTGRVNTHFFKEFETVKSYIDKVYGLVDLVDYYIFNHFKELIFLDMDVEYKMDKVITIDLTEPLTMDGVYGYDDASLVGLKRGII